MKLFHSPWVLAIVLVVVIAAGVTGGLLATRSTSHKSPSKAAASSTTTTTAARSTTTTTAAPLPRVYSVACPGEYPATLTPSEIPLSCADENEYVSGITWSSWTATSAQGHGTLYVNDCTPDCAGGTFQTSPTSVTLSDPVPSRTQGLIFVMVTWITSSGSSDSEDIGCSISSFKYC